MALFSERYNYASPRDSWQIESMDENLRVSIYNIFHVFLGEYDHGSSSEMICRRVWAVFWHRPVDEFPSGYWSFYSALKKWIGCCAWYEPYDLVEFIAISAQACDSRYVEACRVGETMLGEFRSMVNAVLQREGSGYRMVGMEVVPVTNELELASLEATLHATDQFAGSRHHIARAIELLSMKPAPDCPNAVKEAISAVEAAARSVAGNPKGEMGKALEAVRDQGHVHKALIAGWKSIYGFTSDEGGIRHAADSDELVVDAALAKYMVVSCSAFVNYLIEEFGSAESGLSGR